MAKHLLLLRSTVLIAVAVLGTKSLVTCFESNDNDASVVVSPSSASLPKISVSTANDGSSRGRDGSYHSSWWNAFDGIPFLVARRPTRKLSKNNLSNIGGSDNHSLNITPPDHDVDEFHRFLAFGDYADHSFQCPVTTTCPIVCVADVADCPEDAVCPDGSELCADGTCSEA